MAYPRELTALCRHLAVAAAWPGAGGPVAPPPRWSRWLALVEENDLGPWLARRSSGLDLPPDAQRELAAAYSRAVRESLAQNHARNRVIDLLQGLDLVVLKGAALLTCLYAEECERPMGDLDLLVHSAADAERAEQRLLQAGFIAGHGLPHHHHGRALIKPAWQMLVEIHTNLLTPPLAAPFIQAAWDARVRWRSDAPPHAYKLDPAALVVHQAIHALSNPIDSPLLRNLFEVAWLLRRLDAAGRARFQELAALTGRADLVARAWNLAAELFGPPWPEARWTGCSLAPSAYERWGRARVGWGPDRGPLARFRRHVGVMFFAQRVAGQGRARERQALVSVLTGSLRQALANRRRPARAPDAMWRRGPFGAARLADGAILLHDQATDHTHLLNPLASAIWDALAEPGASADLAARLAPHGAGGARVSALRELVRRGIIVNGPAGRPQA